VSSLVESIAEIRRVAQEWRERSDADLALIIRSMPDLELAELATRAGLIVARHAFDTRSAPAPVTAPEAATSTANPTKEGRKPGKTAESVRLILEHLAQGESTWRELITATGINQGTLSTTLQRLQGSNQIESVGPRGKRRYRLMRRSPSGTSSAPRFPGSSTPTESL